MPAKYTLDERPCFQKVMIYSLGNPEAGLILGRRIRRVGFGGQSEPEIAANDVAALN